MANLVHLTVFKKTKIFFEKSISFLNKNQISNVSRSLSIPVAYLLQLAVFKKSQIFLEKPICFLSKTQIFNGWRNFTIPVALCGIFTTFGEFKNIDYFFFSKNPSIFQKRPNSERFETFNYFSRIVRQVCYL